MNTYVMILGVMILLVFILLKYEQKKVKKWRIEFGERFTDAILKQKLEIGMSEEMVYLSWGKPSTNKNRERDNEMRKTWIWNKTDKNHKRYAIFINGKLTEFGDK